MESAMENSEKQTKRTEAAEASKRAILDAAEAVFARKGYDATTLQEICDRAGVTRGLPTYFFGSKEQLYQAVLERVFALRQTQDLVTFLRDQAHHPGTSAEESLRAVIERVFDLLVASPIFLRLTEWEGLSGGQSLGNLPRVLTVLHEAFQVLQEEMGWREDDAEHFLIDLVALCHFPLAHAYTFLKPLGVDAHDPGFLERRKRHVVMLLLGRTSGAAPAP